MNQSARNELESIKRELRSIINEMNDISYGLKREFTGIGTENCAKSVDLVAGQYEYALRRLNSLDTKTVREGFEGGYSAGSGRHG